MGMRCAQEDVPRLDAAALLNLRPGILRESPGDEQQVDADERYSLSSIVKHGGPHFTRIMERAVIRLAVAARRFHAEVRRNVSFGEAGFEHGFVDCGDRSAWRLGGAWMETEDENNCDGHEGYAGRFDH